jgi:hypothetical protein
MRVPRNEIEFLAKVQQLLERSGLQFHRRKKPNRPVVRTKKEGLPYSTLRPGQEQRLKLQLASKREIRLAGPI